MVNINYYGTSWYYDLIGPRKDSVTSGEWYSVKYHGKWTW